MIAVDTNILARYIVKTTSANDEQQTAASFIEAAKELFVARSVLLELEWVLRGVYKQTRHEIHAAFTSLLNTDNVTVEDEKLITEVLRHYQHGLDFADALHLTAAHYCESLATFDKAFAKNAKQLRLKPHCIVPT